MIYCVKINSFMVRDAVITKTKDGYHLREVYLSKEIQRGYDKKTAEIIAHLTDGKVIEVNEEVVEEVTYGG